MIVMEYYSLSKRLWYLYLDYTCKSTNAVQTTLLRKGFLMPSIHFPLVNVYRLVKEIDSISSFSRSQVQKKTSVPSKIVAEPLPERRQSRRKDDNLPERRQSRWWRPLINVPELSCLDQTHSRHTRKPREWEVIHGTVHGIWNRRIKIPHRQTNPQFLTNHFTSHEPKVQEGFSNGQLSVVCLRLRRCFVVISFWHFPLLIQNSSTITSN